MRTKLFVVTLLLVAFSQVASATKTMKVKLVSYSTIETSLLQASNDFLTQWISSDTNRDSLKVRLRNTLDALVSESFKTDIGQVVSQITAKGSEIDKVDQIVPVYEMSKNYPAMQDIYFSQLANQWKNLLSSPKPLVDSKKLSDAEYRKTPTGAVVMAWIGFNELRINKLKNFNKKS
jgi:hypothetical protein